MNPSASVAWRVLGRSETSYPACSRRSARSSLVCAAGRAVAGRAFAALASRKSRPRGCSRRNRLHRPSDRGRDPDGLRPLGDRVRRPAGEPAGRDRRLDQVERPLVRLSCQDEKGREPRPLSRLVRASVSYSRCSSRSRGTCSTSRCAPSGRRTSRTRPRPPTS